MDLPLTVRVFRFDVESLHAVPNQVPTPLHGTLDSLHAEAPEHQAMTFFDSMAMQLEYSVFFLRFIFRFRFSRMHMILCESFQPNTGQRFEVLDMERKYS